MEISLVSGDQLDESFASSKSRICHVSFAKEKLKTRSVLQLYTLYGYVFDTVPVPLPLKKKLNNQGWGIWLLYSAKAHFDLQGKYLDANTMAG